MLSAKGHGDFVMPWQCFWLLELLTLSFFHQVAWGLRREFRRARDLDGCPRSSLVLQIFGLQFRSRKIIAKT
jgi:hypothetical protein